MKAGFRRLSFLALTAALLAPAAVTIRATAQDDKGQEEKRQDSQHNDKNQTRVYDRTHKDYHDWNENEDRSYHQYVGQNQLEFREYNKLNNDQQDQYWNWRHSHPDGDQEKHGDDPEKH